MAKLPRGLAAAVAVVALCQEALLHLLCRRGLQVNTDYSGMGCPEMAIVALMVPLSALLDQVCGPGPDILFLESH